MPWPLDDALAAHERGDYATAFRLYRALADQGNAVAQYKLGLMYYTGQGVPMDRVEAVKWYLKAAERGNARAQYDLGNIYSGGYGVPLDWVQAYIWYYRAADTNDPVMADIKNDAAKRRDRLANELAPKEYAEARWRAREWKPTTK